MSDLSILQELELLRKTIRELERLHEANRELSKQLAIVTAERDKLRGLLGKIIDTIRIDEDE